MLLVFLIVLFGHTAGLADQGRTVYIPIRPGENVRIWCQGKDVVLTDFTACRGAGACYRDLSWFSVLPVTVTCTDQDVTVTATVTREVLRSVNVVTDSEGAVTVECLVSSDLEKLKYRTMTYPQMKWASDARGSRATGNIKTDEYNFADFYFLQSKVVTANDDGFSCNGTDFSYADHNSTLHTTPPIVKPSTTKPPVIPPVNTTAHKTVGVILGTRTPETTNASVLGLSPSLIIIISIAVGLTLLVLVVCLSALYCNKLHAAEPPCSTSPLIRPVYPITSLNEPLVGVVPVPPPLSLIPFNNMTPHYDEIELEGVVGYDPGPGYEASLRLSSASPSPTLNLYECFNNHPRLEPHLSECIPEYSTVKRPQAEGYSVLNAPQELSASPQTEPYSYIEVPGPARSMPDDGYRYNVLRRDGKDDTNYQYNVLKRK